MNSFCYICKECAVPCKLYTKTPSCLTVCPVDGVVADWEEVKDE
jgi:hypothetical protein